MTSKKRPHSLARVALTILFAISFIFFVRTVRESANYILHGEQIVRPPFGLNDITLEIEGLSPDAEAAGLRNGDVLLGVDGRPFEGFTDYWGAIRRAKLGDDLQVRVRSSAPAGPVEKDVSVKLPVFTYVGITKAQSRAFGWIILPSILLPLFCFVLGFWVAAARIADRAAWLLLLLLLGVATTITETRTLFGTDDSLQPFLTGFVFFFRSLTPLALVFFGIIFPERLAFDRRFPWVKWVVFGPILVAATLGAVFVALLLHHQAMARAMWPVFQPFSRIENYVLPSAFVFFCALLVYRTVTSQSRDARRRLLLLDVGTAIGILPYATFYALAVSHKIQDSGWEVIAAAAPLLIFPLTMAYVIVVHRAMEVRMALRQGLQYVLATRGIRILQLVLSVAIILEAATMSQGISSGQRIVFFSIAFALVAGLRRFAQRLREWIDRAFFREAYETDTILADLATRVGTMRETHPLLETVVGRIADSLHVPQIAILLKDGDAFRPAYALGFAGTPAASLPAGGLTVKRLRNKHALVEFDDDNSWVQLAEDGERMSLEELRSNLLLPLSLDQNMLGIMSLGAKQSEEPYSGGDIRLLDSVAAQTALSLENGRLTQAIAAEVAAREKHKRELEIAHEVQERLFPQDYPPIPGVDYRGACRPALGVGGDYYDFILLPENRLGIAIGDVSGKGIPAALLMATLRAYLRAQAVQRQTDLTEVMTNLNKLVYESSDAGRYATFFYGEFDATTRELRYVNAGHCAPMIFRAADGGSDVTRLDVGGPVVGLLEECEYSQACLNLERGDLFVAYTDGMSEAMNSADEEWGETRLAQAVRAHPAVPAQDLIPQLMQSADTFVAGAPQHDDMTVSIIRMV